jgi:tetratricopeptide (TPR) repeat protein
VQSAADIEQLIRDGKKAKALAEYRKLIAAQPDNIDAHRGYQNLMRELGDIERVRKEYQAKLDASPDSALYNYLYGRLMEGAELEKAFQQAIKLDKTFFWAYYGLGQFYSNSHKYDESIKHFEATLKLKPDFAEARHSLAMMLYETGELDRAIAEWTKVLESKPNYAEAQLGQALGFKAKGDYGRAVESLQALTEKGYWRAYEPLIQCLHAIGNYKMGTACRAKLNELKQSIPAIPNQIIIDLVRTQEYLIIAREQVRSEYNRVEFDVYLPKDKDDKLIDIASRQPDKSFYTARIKETTRIFLKKEGTDAFGKQLAEEVLSYLKLAPSYQRLLTDIKEYLKN